MARVALLSPLVSVRHSSLFSVVSASSALPSLIASARCSPSSCVASACALSVSNAGDPFADGASLSLVTSFCSLSTISDGSFLSFLPFASS